MKKITAPGNQELKGVLNIIRPSKLEKPTKELVIGVYEKAEPNKFDASKKDYFFRDTTTNDLTVVNETATLKQLLNQEGLIGQTIRIDYNGKKKTKKGKEYHDFECFVV